MHSSGGQARKGDISARVEAMGVRLGAGWRDSLWKWDVECLVVCCAITSFW